MTWQPAPPYLMRGPRPPSWWRVNRGWLVLLAIGLTMAILTSSYALGIVQSADEPSEHQVAVDGRIEFSTRSLDKPVVISLELVSQAVKTKADGYQAAPGATIWIITMNFVSITPSDAAMSCHAFLADSEGRLYGAGAGLLGTGPIKGATIDCGDSGAQAPRKKSWWFGVPDSVQIVAFYLSWDDPRIAVFPLAAP